MILTLKRIEIAILLFNISSMRKSVRTFFKKKYKKQHKEALQLFDSLKPQLEDAVEKLEGDYYLEHLEYTEDQLQVLSSFLEAYIPKIEDFLKELGKTNDEDRQNLEHLMAIQEKVNCVKEIHAIA